ncbi:WD40-repeat-containing domain protein [Jimgerdemannia flammicorona]|uniref:WD40-repeat-containing domain protein n=1 Tax=Jimgerdemannia flammicorona TaxID=994334 RepID=A0A433A104_9FUNG|nr:WD40-repeat-containing domain protein [Jimgerdemannia flammicorona]
MQPYQRLTGHSKDVSYCAWSPDSSMLLTCSTEPDNLKLWDVSTGTCKHDLRKHDDQVTSCAWLPDGNHFVSGAMTKSISILLWNIDGSMLHKWSGPRVMDLAVNREGTLMYAICSEKKIWAYDLTDKTTQALWSIQETDPITSISLTLDDRYALVNLQTAQELHLWDLENKVLVHKYVGHNHLRYVLRSCFGGINQRFVVSGSEGMLGLLLANLVNWCRELAMNILRN